MQGEPLGTSAPRKRRGRLRVALLLFALAVAARIGIVLAGPNSVNGGWNPYLGILFFASMFAAVGFGIAHIVGLVQARKVPPE